MDERARKIKFSKVPGIYVPPPPPGKIRTKTERIQAIQKRAIDKSWLDAKPTVVEFSDYTDACAKQAAKQNAYTQRRRRNHLEFLKCDPSVQEIRLYIQNIPYRMRGVWEEERVDEETGEIYPAEWVNYRNEYESSDQSHKRECAFYDSERIRIQNLFAGEFGETNQPSCQHGQMWYEKCPRCEAEQDLISKGHDPNLLNFEDAENVKHGNTRSANTVLAALGNSLWAGKSKKEVYAGNTTGNGKLNAIDAAFQRDEALGGKKKIGQGLGYRSEVGVVGHGSDSDAAPGDDHVGGSQTSLPADPNYEGNKTVKSLGFKSGEVGGKVAASPLPEFDRVIQGPIKSGGKDELLVPTEERVLPPADLLDQIDSIESDQDKEEGEVSGEHVRPKVDTKAETKIEETEIDSETYDPNADEDLKPEEEEDADE